MSMNVGSGSSSGEPEVLMDINTTPLIDVMLVLLVMLIITIPIQLHAVNLDMPVGAPPANNIKPEKVQIDIDEASVVYWQGLPVSAQELEEKMTVLAQMPFQPEVHIRP
ncbi:MAG: biopolymer transporter ExbD, partial [Comamonadaceae bacterium]